MRTKDTSIPQMALKEDSIKSVPYRPLPPIQTVFAPPAPPPAPKPEIEPLTAVQIENWRNHLLRVIGPFATLLSNAEIQRVRDEIQSLHPGIARSVSERTKERLAPPGKPKP